MKRIVVLLFCLALCGCNAEQPLDKALQLRQRLITSEGYAFDAAITADYGTQIHKFGFYCEADADGNISFTVTAPDTISGISGTIGTNGGALTFDDQILAFELMAEERISPIAAPWILIRALTSGYIQSCSDSEAGLQLMISDSYEEDALMLRVFADDNMIINSAELFWQERRIISIEIENFKYL